MKKILVFIDYFTLYLYCIYLLFQFNMTSLPSPQSESPTTLTIDLGNWMSNLPPKLKYVPFIYLAIPGSHDSMTYSITSQSEFAPDAYEWLKKLDFLGKPLRAIVARWSITQTANTKTQLENGIRYLDLRLATKTGTDEFYYCHGLYGPKINTSFDDINEFLYDHPGEIVILDFQHFYGFTDNDHERLIDLIKNSFGNRILKFSWDPNRLTLNYLISNRIQVVVIYRSGVAQGTGFWPGGYFPTPWPETTSIPRLLSILDYGLRNRPEKCGYVSQCLLTPDTGFIIKKPFATLRSSCAIVLQKPMLMWLGEQTPGNGKLNVTIADFVEIDNWIYCKKVVDLNLKFM